MIFETDLVTDRFTEVSNPDINLLEIDSSDFEKILLKKLQNIVRRGGMGMMFEYIFSEDKDYTIDSFPEIMRLFFGDKKSINPLLIPEKYKKLL